MKLSNEALLEVVYIIQNALVRGEDASQGLRDLDLVVRDTEDGCELKLSNDYIASHPRETNLWDEGAEA